MDYGMIQRLNKFFGTVEMIQRYKRFQTDFSGTISKAIPKNLLGNAKSIKDESALAKFTQHDRCCATYNFGLSYSSNGLCKQQNKTIKDSLVKVLDRNPGDLFIYLLFFLYSR